MPQRPANSVTLSFPLILPLILPLVSTGADGLIRHWDQKTGQELPGPDVYLGCTHAAYSSDGLFAPVADAMGRVDLWDAVNGKRLRVLQREGPAVNRLAFAPDGKSLAIAQANGTVQFRDVLSGREGKILRWEEPRDQPFIRTLLFSPDGCFVCVSDYTREMRLWEVATGKLRWRGRDDCAAAFTPDGATLV